MGKVTDEDWQEVVSELDDYIGTPNFAWGSAIDILIGIQATIREIKVVTKKQRQAIDNIVAATERRNQQA